MGTAKTRPADGVWAEQTVDMPGMGPGANKAGWWVSYLNELMMLGKYEEVLKWLATARQTGAIFAIIKSKEEMNQTLVAEKKVNRTSGLMKRVEVEYKAKLGMRKCTSNPRSQCNEVPTKTEPYFYTQGKVA